MWGSFLKKSISTQSFLKNCDSYILVSYKRVSYKKKTCICINTSYTMAKNIRAGGEDVLSHGITDLTRPIILRVLSLDCHENQSDNFFILPPV